MAILLCKCLILQIKNRAHLKAYVKRIIASFKNIFYNKNIMLFLVIHAARVPKLSSKIRLNCIKVYETIIHQPPSTLG